MLESLLVRYNELKNLASAHFTEGSWEEAIRALDELHRHNPLDLDVLWKMGICSARLNRVDEAIRYLKKCTILAPGRGDIFAQVGSLLDYTGADDEALMAYRSALASNSGTFNSVVLSGAISLLTKRLSSAASSDPALLIPVIYEALALVENDGVDAEKRMQLGYLAVSILAKAGLCDDQWQNFLKNELWRLGQERVLSGPFKGMRLSGSFVANNDCHFMIGVNKPKMDNLLVELSSKNYDHIFDIGAGSGYYSVGLALACPRSNVVSWEADRKKRAICQEMAKLNGVEPRVNFLGEAEPDDVFARTRPAERPLFLINAKGFELELLTEEFISEFCRADFIVECHDYIGFDIGKTLSAQFAETHEVELSGQHRVDAWSFGCLRHLDPVLRWYAVYGIGPATTILLRTKTWVHARSRMRG